MSIRVSRLLVEGGYYNEAISRCYYAMFYAASALLLSKGHRFKKHSQLISAFGQYFVKEGKVPKELHAILIAAFDERTDADYVPLRKFEKKDAIQMLKDAEKFCRSIKKILKEKKP